MPFTPINIWNRGKQITDALIKKGQMEMAKGAFKTQLEVLEKVHPEQYEKYKKLKVEDLAADAVLQQAEVAKLQPKTGNPMVDMLNENGIPIASSLKGIEQAIKTQKEMETQDPSEQIAKAVLEKFQTQILPGLVANMIAGRNPFKIPQQMRSPQAQPVEVRRMALQSQQTLMPTEERLPPKITTRSRDPEAIYNAYIEENPRVRLNPEVASALINRRLRDEPIQSGRALAGESGLDYAHKVPKLDTKSSLVLGLHEIFEDDEDDNKDGENNEDNEDNHIRRSPLSLSPAFAESLKSNAEVREALEKIKYRVDDVEQYLKPKPLMRNPNPQPGYFVPRKLPQRPRKMLPLVVGIDPEEEKEEIRRSGSSQLPGFINKKSRVLTNLQNNPSIAPLFLDGNLEEILSGREILTPEQKGKQRIKQIKAYPRLFGTKTYNPIDGKVSQIIEERPIPPMAWTPKGRHTRLRWVGATEKEIPGIGGRFILPSLDPTKPAVNTAYSTQGRARDEWDTMFKIPNNWQAGDDVGFSMNTKSKRFVGGNGGFDMPAAHL
ncbi:hypothetical protein TELCIR_04178 [Teladorsagia circumcincta]|uniref:Uncharacterized protein n=1 Tax=Teladorsagia circumcincta TaxID=45464 RepID=A0A2G9UUB8_TELCI|nr:hypothetical protein TELCIR_04178 [Teladorsagia circumcincta]